MIKPIAILLGVALFWATPAHADPGHQALVDALTRAGVRVFFDHQICKTDRVYGFYHNPSKSLVVCNEGSGMFDENDLDTLRHEAIHVIQDCANGTLGDNRMGLALKPGISRQMLAQAGIDITKIEAAYGRRGVKGVNLELEYEAFGAAATVPASTIAEVVGIMCSTNR